jgi:2-polyprenyl-3-methyl-5-hydroxy-6-metoxy-1,4-benzoquinol methylase
MPNTKNYIHSIQTKLNTQAGKLENIKKELNGSQKGSQEESFLNFELRTREHQESNTPNTNSMRGINSYGKELSHKDIQQRKHRKFVGGLWEQIGRLQYDFLIEQGLKPFHKLLDVGCGCLRGGIYYIQYLDEGNYCGLDINHSLIQAGMVELKEAGLEEKHPKLLVDDSFRLNKFNEKFDFMVSVSLFTHLPMNMIIRCLSAVKQQLKPNGIYFSSFFQAPSSVYLEKLHHQPGGATTNYDSDPFHYSFEELLWMASIAGLEVQLIGDWNHPRNQKMAVFYLQ